MAVFTLQAPFAILAALLAVAFVGRNLATLVARFRRNVAILQCVLALAGLASSWKLTINICRDYPGLRLVFHPHTVFGLLPRIPGVNIGDQYIRRYRTARTFSPAHFRSFTNP